MFCSQCGTDNRETSRFCRNCGTALRSATGVVENARNHEQDESNAFQRAVAGQFRVNSLLRTEASAITYLCSFAGSSANCWIRVLPRHLLNNPDAIGLFHLEAQAGSRLSHPNIQRVLESDEASGFHYVVMEAVAGETLREVVESHPVASDEAVAIIRAIVFTLDYAHRSGVLHLNLKTENIGFTADGSPLLIGFGIPNGREYSNLFGRRGRSASPEYISPEQILGKAIDYRADYYSLGIILYELLTGRTPFSSAPAAEIFFRHLNEEPADPRSINPSITPALSDVVLRMLAKEPTNRYLTTTALIKALDEARHIPSSGENRPEKRRNLDPVERSGGEDATQNDREDLPPRRVSPLPRIGNDESFGGTENTTMDDSDNPEDIERGPINFSPAPIVDRTQSDSTGKTIEYQPQRIIESAAIPVSESLPENGPVTNRRLRLVKPSEKLSVPSLENYVEDVAVPADSRLSTPLKFPKKPLNLILMIIALILLMAVVVPAISWYLRKDALQAAAAAKQAAIENARRQPPAGMVMIPGGQFLRGSNDGKLIERPLNTVAVDDFYMDYREVTNNHYLRFITATNRPAPANWPEGKVPAGWEALPVTDVTWNDAAAFCQWRSRPEGYKVRLPTEAEWEYAARGQDGRRYPWGNEWVAGNVNGNDSGRNQPAAVGSFAAGNSPFGLQDMSGNVWEWTADNLTLYPDSKAKIDPLSARDKVIRGGSFADSPDTLTTSYRSWMAPETMSEKIGFRCVATK